MSMISVPDGTEFLYFVFVKYQSYIWESSTPRLNNINLYQCINMYSVLIGFTQ